MPILKTVFKSSLKPIRKGWFLGDSAKTNGVTIQVKWIKDYTVKRRIKKTTKKPKIGKRKRKVMNMKRKSSLQNRSLEKTTVCFQKNLL